MDDVSLKSRAVVFALCAGGIAFFLALLVTTGAVGWSNYARALIPAIVCGALCWASAERIVSTTAAALDSAIARMVRAGDGDLESAIPDEIGTALPPLSRAMTRLFSQLRANIDSIERLAMFDAVTGLPNWTYVRVRAEALLAALPEGAGAAVLFVDLDRFKIVNDTKGHAAGDQLLAQVAERLRAVGAASGHANSLAGRLAGDEFTLFVPAIGREAAGQIGRAVLAALGAPFAVGGATLQMGASVGIALYPAHGTTLHDLMRAADQAMYQAKASGRGRVEFFSDALSARLADREALDGELRDALDGGQFTLAFQPQVSLRDGRIVAAEALLRWKHPTQGMRLPGSFLARAEETGLIVEIGDWVVGDVARTVARWAAIGSGQRLAINVSRRQVEDPGFFRHLHRAIRVAGAPASLLEIEVSETLATECGSEAVEAIATLRAAGATVSIDQFGTGYSNILRLRSLPVDRYKLDRRVTERITEDVGARAIAQAMVGLIHGLGCEAVGEGVETEAQIAMLRVIGCDVIQGYAVAPPMGEAAFLAWAGRETPTIAARA